MSEETQVLRERIRSYEIKPCNHGAECDCAVRVEWENAIKRIYEIERQEEAMAEVVRLSEEAGLYE